MSTLTEQLTKVARRYDELNQLMAEPEVLADYERLNDIGRRSEATWMTWSIPSGAMRTFKIRLRATVN